MYILLLYICTCLVLSALDLCCWAQVFSSCCEQRAALCCGSHCSGFSCWGTRTVGAWASVVAALSSVFVTHGLSCSMACGILPDQGLNIYPFHWQVDSQLESWTTGEVPSKQVYNFVLWHFIFMSVFCSLKWDECHYTILIKFLANI